MSDLLGFLSEALPIILSSATISGSVFACVLTVAIKKAKRDAEQKRKERLRLEILRLEGEEKLSNLLFALLRTYRGNSSIGELESAINDYTAYLENSRKLKNEIIGIYTIN